MTSTSCSHDRKDLVLYAYDELDAAARDDVEARLTVCRPCRTALESIRALEQDIPREPSVELPDEALDAIRRSTSHRLRRERERATAGGLATLWMPLMRRPSLVAATFVICIAAAFLLGRQMVRGPESGSALTADRAIPDVMSVSDISYDKQTGAIQVSFAAVEQSSVEGSISDPVVRAVLAQALRDDRNPVARLRAANVLAETEPLVMRPDESLVRSLAGLLAEEDNEGIQLQALQAVARLHQSIPLPDFLIDVLIGILENADNSALRIQALKLLTESEIASMRLAEIMEGARDDRNAYVRQQAEATLEELGHPVPLEQR